MCWPLTQSPIAYTLECERAEIIAALRLLLSNELLLWEIRRHVDALLYIVAQEQPSALGLRADCRTGKNPTTCVCVNLLFCQQKAL